MVLTLEADKMNKHELWEKFIKSGKVSDYLKYKNASKHGGDDLYEGEYAEEFYIDDPNMEDFNYDPQDGRYNNP